MSVQNVEVRGAFKYDAVGVSDATALSKFEDTLAIQSGKEEADINVLVKRFGITGELPSNVRIPLQGQFAVAGDFKTSMDLIREAEAGFMELPADVRARFHHNPGELVAFVSDDKNRAEAVALGIVVEAPKAMRSVPAEPAPASGASALAVGGAAV